MGAMGQMEHVPKCTTRLNHQPRKARRGAANRGTPAGRQPAAEVPKIGPKAEGARLRAAPEGLRVEVGCLSPSVRCGRA